MFKKTIIAGLVAGVLGSATAQAQQPPASSHTLTGNIGLFSQYIFRGLTQTNEEPALQGGMDYAHSAGFYAGTWGSNVSVLRDTNAYTGGGSLELDIYGGFKGSIGKSDFGYDVGLLYYWYPGDAAPGITEADTLELYGAITWKWLSAKLSYSLQDDTFGVRDSRGTYYLDLTATYPIPNTRLTLIGHYGMQEFDGNGVTCTGGNNNDQCASYKDYKVGVNYSLPKDFTVGVFYTGTDMTSAQELFYTANGKKLGDGGVTVFVQKTF
ncbi:MAG TPA: TorF family putative porin [Burkholderiales bacterium]|nr:TorF family putative porin [Burkholderiales bacterium]